MINFLKGCADLVNDSFYAMWSTSYFRFVLSLAAIMICYGFFCFVSRRTRNM